MAEMFSRVFTQDLFSELAHLRAVDPHRKVELPPEGTQALLLTRYADVMAMLRDPAVSTSQRSWASADFLRSAFALPPGTLFDVNMTMSDGPLHDAVKRLVVPYFSTSAVEGLAPMVRAEIQEALRVFPENPDVGDFAGRVAGAVINRIMGVSVDYAWLMPRICTLLTLDAVDKEKVGKEVAAQMVQEAKRAKDPGGGTPTLVLRELCEEKLLEEETMLGMFSLMLMAGVMNLRNVLAGSVLALLESPDQRPFVSDLGHDGVEELVRFVSPVTHGLFRFPVVSVKVGSARISGRMPLLLSFAAANRDPDVFKDPDRLDLRRRSRPNVGFGGGIHRCVAPVLGRMAVRSAVPAFFERFPRVELAGEVGYAHSMLVRYPVSVPVELGT
jgi:cytochrome P450